MTKKEYEKMVQQVEENNLNHSMKRMEELEQQGGAMFEVEKMKAFVARNNLAQVQQPTTDEKEKAHLIERLQFELDLNNILLEVRNATEPVKVRQVGDSVYCKVLGPSVVIEVLENGSVYRVEPNEAGLKQYKLYKAWYTLADLI